MNRSSIMYRKTVLQVIPLLITLLFTISPELVQGMNGRQVYEKVHDLRIKGLDRKDEFTMTLFDKGGGIRSRAAVEYSKKGEGENYKVLVVFKTPPDLCDVGFLVHARTFSDRDLWAYFPEFKRIRRIPTTSQDDSFFGSDFSYDDFGGPPNLDDYSFTILREEVVDSRPCYVVEVMPKVHRKWSRNEAWVDKELFVHRKIVYYQGKEPYRAGTFTDVRIIDDLPTPFRMEMENMKTGHRTEVILLNIQYHISHPDDLFTQRSLERAGK
jgi:uncharacterized protein